MTEGGGLGEPRRPATSYDGVPASELARRLDLPRLEVFDVIGSTMDVAHTLAAEGAPGGTTVLADRQASGRGRQGRTWHSSGGRGVWVTVVDRPRDPEALEVLSLRVGLAIAEAVESLAPSPVRLKWPNDLFVDAGKLAGILVEARWRNARPDWVAIGVGLNVRSPDAVQAGALRPDVSRIEALSHIVPAIRDACRATGALDRSELARFAARDLAAGRAVLAPVAGTVRGLDASGAIVITTPDGDVACRTGSLQFAEDL